jgi:hypothetical protein
MMAMRWAMLLLASAGVLAALGVTGAHQQASALRLVVTAVVAVLAPLFWPGNAARPARTLLRIVAWSSVAAAWAAAALWLLGKPAQPLWPVVTSCGVLMLMLLAAHGLAAVLEACFRGPSGAASGASGGARETAGRAVAFALVLLGSMPLWLGPVAELLSARHAWIIDAVIGLSPLAHLAVASGNDLLRNPWLYQHANLAVLPFSYPGLSAVAGMYALFGLMLALIALAFGRPRRPVR